MARLAKAAATGGQLPPLPDDLSDEVKISVSWLLAVNLAHHLAHPREASID